MEHEQMTNQKDAIQLVEYQYAIHKGKWLDWDAVCAYRKHADLLRENYAASSAIRNLVLQLWHTYDLQEIEAINIINGYGAEDYVYKYQRIKAKVPLKSRDKDEYIVLPANKHYDSFAILDEKG